MRPRGRRRQPIASRRESQRAAPVARGPCSGSARRSRLARAPGARRHTLAVPAAPEISVVIPCLDEEAAVGMVVEQAWEGIERSGRSGEVIVVDNGSTDRSAELAASYGATVVSEPRRGYGR